MRPIYWYYSRAAFIPAGISFFATMIFTIRENQHYSSEWLTRESVIEMAFVYTLGYVIFLCLLCLPIFLVKLDTVKRSRILTFLSWFLLPVSWMTAVFIHELRFDLQYGGKPDSDLLYVALLNLPYLAGLIWTYISFTRRPLNRTPGDFTTND